MVKTKKQHGHTYCIVSLYNTELVDFPKIHVQFYVVIVKIVVKYIDLVLTYPKKNNSHQS